MTIKRYPAVPDFAFLSPLWELVKNPRNGLLCGDNIPKFMEQNGFTKTTDDNWTHPSFHGSWVVSFAPENETLWIMEANKESWQNPLVLQIKSATIMRGKL